MDAYQEHCDFHYASDAERDRAGASEMGAGRPELAWICSDRDVWYRNPFYQGPPVRHPEDDRDEDEPQCAPVDTDMECPF